MSTVEEISTITAKGQTTVPKAVRQALGVGYGGKVAFRVDKKGVTLHRVEEEESDPVLGQFLSFLAKDMKKRPQAIRSLTPVLAKHLRELTKGVEVNLDEPIEGPVDL